MHQRNLYISLDFKDLADKYKELRTFLIRTHDAKITIDFKDPAAARCLQQAVLSRDFNLRLNLPKDKLCPPVPNRLNYILWLQDLVRETRGCSGLSSEEIVGVDIGTGASAIYPLLGVRIEPSWKFIGTEISQSSCEIARENVKQNRLETQIDIQLVEQSQPILQPLFRDTNRSFTFTMCNPPFYASEAEIEESAAGKAQEPNSVCTGAVHEMVTEGGEERFVLQMLEESTMVDMRERCWWYTSMVGKLSTLNVLVKRLKAAQIDNYALTELVQGQTRRWVVAWSFRDIRLSDSLTRNLPAAHRSLFPLSNELRHSVDHDISTCVIANSIMSNLQTLDGVTIQNLNPLGNIDGDAPAVSDSCHLRVSAAVNSWSRAARRLRAKESSEASAQVGAEARLDQTDRSYGIVLDISLSSSYGKGEGKRVLLGRWRRGRDRALLESLWGHVCRRATGTREPEVSGQSLRNQVAGKRVFSTVEADMDADKTKRPKASHEIRSSEHVATNSGSDS